MDSLFLLTQNLLFQSCASRGLLFCRLRVLPVGHFAVKWTALRIDLKFKKWSPELQLTQDGWCLLSFVFYHGTHLTRWLDGASWILWRHKINDAIITDEIGNCDVTFEIKIMLVFLAQVSKQICLYQLNKNTVSIKL